MKGKKRDKSEALIELAWRTAFDSATYKVEGDLTEEELRIATSRIRNIDKSEWYPEARYLLSTNPYMDDHRLAEDAASRFINKEMGKKGLIVTFRGDW